MSKQDDEPTPNTSLLGMLKNMGVDLDVPRLIEHSFYCPDAATVWLLAADVAAIGLEMDEEYSDLYDGEDDGLGKYTLDCREMTTPNKQAQENHNLRN